MQDDLANLRAENKRLRGALENLCGDVYLYSLGEIRTAQLSKTQREGIEALRMNKGSRP